MTNCRLRCCWWLWWQRYCNLPLPPIDSESGGNDDDGERSCCCCWEWVVETHWNIPETRSVENSSFSFIALVRMWSIQKRTIWEEEKAWKDQSEEIRPVCWGQTDTQTDRQTNKVAALGPHCRLPLDPLNMRCSIVRWMELYWWLVWNTVHCCRVYEIET